MRSPPCARALAQPHTWVIPVRELDAGGRQSSPIVLIAFGMFAAFMLRVAFGWGRRVGISPNCRGVPLSRQSTLRDFGRCGPAALGAFSHYSVPQVVLGAATYRGRTLSAISDPTAAATLRVAFG